MVEKGTKEEQTAALDLRKGGRRRNKPRIIQCGVFGKGLSEEFILRDREDGRGAILVK